MTTPLGRYARLYDVALWPAERLALAAWRDRVGGVATGRVLEVGTGTGAMLSHWGPAVESVVAVEFDVRMAARARRRAARAGVATTVVEAAAESLPFAAAAFDTVVFSLTLCSVFDPRAALAEARRVLAPGGRLLLLEHVHVGWQPARRLQSLAAPAWAALAGGCRLDRDTPALLTSAGFTIYDLRRHVAGWVVEIVAAAPPAPAPAAAPPGSAAAQTSPRDLG